MFVNFFIVRNDVAGGRKKVRKHGDEKQIFQQFSPEWEINFPCNREWKEERREIGKYRSSYLILCGFLFKLAAIVLLLIWNRDG